LGAWPGDSKYNCENGYGCGPPTLLPIDRYGTQTRWVGIGSGGPKDTEWRAYPSVPWLRIEPEHGNIKRDGSSDMRAYISVNWDKYDNQDSATITLAGNEGSNVTITVPVFESPPPPKKYKGFVQGDGYVVMEAAHYSSKSSAESYSYEVIDGYGRTLSGVSVFPVTAYNFTLGSGPSLTYDFWAHQDSEARITIQIGPSNNFIYHKQLAFGVQVDKEEPKTLFPIPTNSLMDVSNGNDNRAKEIGAVPSDWINVVSSEIRNVTLSANISRGAHELKIYGMSAGIVLERIWVDYGGIAERGWSYLGPPESLRME